MKKSTIYTIIILVWIILLGLFARSLVSPIIGGFEKNIITGVVMIFSTLFVAYFWLNGLKDIVYTLFFYLRYQKNDLRQITNEKKPKVLLLYCTCNDFNPQALGKSMYQNYPNYEVVILDDSKNEEIKERIDLFSLIHNVPVIRRADRVGFKAGNLNNYLQSAVCDYFVILDSDEIIPEEFINQSLPYFQDDKTAIVQGNHIATNSRNKFMALFSDGVESHWNTYQAIKDRYGFLSFLGHGAMIRKSAYDAVGGFPYLVAEDLCFSIELRRQGYYVKFAPEIICLEEYPVSYLAFKKRHSKWTQGNMEFIKRYSLRVLFSSMHWYEKLDLVLFTYSLPLTFIFSLYLAINIIALPLLHFTPHYSVMMLIPTVLFLLSPMLNDTIYFWKRKTTFATLNYLTGSIILYGSMFFISLKSSISALFGKADFIVTPKEDEKVSIYQAVRLNYQEILFAFLLFTISYIFLRSVLPVLLIGLPSLISIRLTLLSNNSIVT